MHATCCDSLKLAETTTEDLIFRLFLLSLFAIMHCSYRWMRTHIKVNQLVVTRMVEWLNEWMSEQMHSSSRWRCSLAKLWINKRVPNWRFILIQISIMGCDMWGVCFDDFGVIATNVCRCFCCFCCFCCLMCNWSRSNNNSANCNWSLQLSGVKEYTLDVARKWNNKY